MAGIGAVTGGVLDGLSGRAHGAIARAGAFMPRCLSSLTRSPPSRCCGSPWLGAWPRCWPNADANAPSAKGGGTWLSGRRGGSSPAPGSGRGLLTTRAIHSAHGHRSPPLPPAPPQGRAHDAGDRACAGPRRDRHRLGADGRAPAGRVASSPRRNPRASGNSRGDCKRRPAAIPLMRIRSRPWCTPMGCRRQSPKRAPWPPAGAAAIRAHVAG